MKKILIILLSVSCTMLPKGDPQLKRSMEEDKEFKTGSPTSLPSQLNRGRPIYLEIQSYPQLISGGHISLGGKIYLFSGREELRLDEIIKPTNSLVTDNSRPEKISRFVVTVPTPSTPEVIHVNIPKEDNVNTTLSSSEDLDLVNAPLTPGSMTFEDAERLKDSSVKSSQSCIRPVMLKNNGCEDMEVNLSFTECANRKDIRKTKKEYCFNDRALFTHSHEGATFEIHLKSVDGKKFLPAGEVVVTQ